MLCARISAPAREFPNLLRTSMSYPYACRKPAIICPVPFGPQTSNRSARSKIHPVSHRSGMPTVWSECRCVKNNFRTSFSGTPACASRMVHPRPASNSRFSFPACIRMLAPKRSIIGRGVPVPSSVTFIACPHAVLANRNSQKPCLRLLILPYALLYCSERSEESLPDQRRSSVQHRIRRCCLEPVGFPRCARDMIKTRKFLCLHQIHYLLR